MASGFPSNDPARAARDSALAGARRDVLVLSILIGAVALLIWNGSSFFQRLSAAGNLFEPELKVIWIALTLNVALILFGWRRYVDVQHEAAQRSDSEARARTLATTDTMTGLGNRKGFADDGALLRAAAAARGETLLLLSVHLHRFKAVNDRHGFDVGDAVVREIAAAVRDQAPPDALLARISGDEFALAMATPADGLAAATDLGYRLLQAVTKPFAIGEHYVQVGAFVGIASAQPAECSIGDLLRRSDIAVAHARSARTARPIWFDAGMERALVAQGEVEQGIRFGIEHDQFVPYFEPQVDLDTGAISGFEVLARWDHPLNGMIPPDRFIPVAEEVGLIDKLSDQVMKKALLAAVGWDPRISIAVNISPAQFADSWLAQKLLRLLTETRFPPERLIVEITESSLFADLELARAIVTSLKAQGIRIALDDFGTGFSSLAHLRALPFDMLKIDRAFVANVATDKDSAAIVRAVTALAQALHVPVTVEGIEDAAMLEAVVGLGCDKAQGWYFGKPTSAETAARLLMTVEPERQRAIG